MQRRPTVSIELSVDGTMIEETEVCGWFCSGGWSVFIVTISFLGLMSIGQVQQTAQSDRHLMRLIWKEVFI